MGHDRYDPLDPADWRGFMMEVNMAKSIAHACPEHLRVGNELSHSRRDTAVADLMGPVWLVTIGFMISTARVQYTVPRVHGREVPIGTSTEIRFEGGFMHVSKPITLGEQAGYIMRKVLEVAPPSTWEAAWRMGGDNALITLLQDTLDVVAHGVKLEQTP